MEQCMPTTQMNPQTPDNEVARLLRNEWEFHLKNPELFIMWAGYAYAILIPFTK